MASPTEQFFAALSERGHDPSLRRVSGTIEYDIRRPHHRSPDRYLVTVARGQLAVAEGAAIADDVAVDGRITADRADFDAMVRNELDPMVAWLRGLATMEGDRELLVLSRRLFRAVTDPASTQRGLPDPGVTYRDATGAGAGGS